MNSVDKLLGGGFLKGHKTYLVAISGAVTLIIQYLIGDIGLMDMIAQISIPLGILYARMGMKSAETK